MRSNPVVLCCVVDVVDRGMKMRGAGEAFCLLLVATVAAAQVDTRHLSGQSRKLSFGNGTV